MTDREKPQKKLRLEFDSLSEDKKIALIIALLEDQIKMDEFNYTVSDEVREANRRSKLGEYYGSGNANALLAFEDQSGGPPIYTEEQKRKFQEENDVHIARLQDALTNLKQGNFSPALKYFQEKYDEGINMLENLMQPDEPERLPIEALLKMDKEIIDFMRTQIN